MRLVLLIVAISLAGLAAPASSLDPPPTLLGPICHVDGAPFIAGPHRLVMLPGMGDDHMAADTHSADAQRWFDYGLTLARSFEHADAILAFQRAEAADPHCSLCVWGEAYARGPTINYPVSPAQSAANLALAQQAQALGAGRASPSIAQLQAALIDRYRGSDPGLADRSYADDLDAMHRADPGNVETAVFDAEAWLIVQNDGDAVAAAHAVQVLQPLIPTHLDSSGLIHFYVHATENAGVPELAAPYADLVAELAPNASHMVHMPSHTDFRIGRYEAAALANVAALKADRAYAEATDSPTPLGRLMYHFHDIQFGLDAAMMSGDGAIALGMVRQFDQDFPAPATYDQHAEMAAGQAYMALGRFAAPARVLAAPDTVSADPFLEAMRHYARGEAYLRLGRAADVRGEAAAIGPLLAATSPSAQPSTPVILMQIAQLILQGDADMLDRAPAAAATAFGKAAALQDSHPFADKIDPPRWWYPVRRSLAGALLAEGDAVGAQREATAALGVWKLDPLTLVIRAAAERRLRAAGAADDMLAARRGWHGDPRALRADQLS